MKDNEKLKSMLSEQEKSDKSLYSAGPYWAPKTKKIAREILANSLEDFRGLDGSRWTLSEQSFKRQLLQRSIARNI